MFSKKPEKRTMGYFLGTIAALIIISIASNVLIYEWQHEQLIRLEYENQNLKKQIENDQSLIEYYQSQYTSQNEAYNDLRTQVNMYVLHPNEEDKEFITPFDPAVFLQVQEITGGWSSQSDIEKFWRDVKRMYEWVIDNIPHRSDGLYPLLPADIKSNVFLLKDMWQFPNQTLELKEGDCEDQSLLLCSMIQSYGSIFPCECICIKSSSSSHAAVEILVPGHKLVILDPAGIYYSQDSEGNISFRSVNDEISIWLNHWKLSMGEDIHVDRVLSEIIDKSFMSTDEYISWMNSR